MGAGLDLKELYAPLTSEDKLKRFWITLTKTLIKVYRLPKVTVAAIAGACPAGGCGLSLCCDFRVITHDGSMGLNEVAIGIPVPKYWIDLMVTVIGQRAAERMLMTGALYSPPKLLEIGMVDEVVATREDLVPSAVRQL